MATSWYDSRRRVDLLTDGGRIDRRETTTWVQALGFYGPEVEIGAGAKPKESWDQLFNFSVPSVYGQPIGGIPKLEPQPEPFNRHAITEPLAADVNEPSKLRKIFTSPYTAAFMMLTATAVVRNKDAIDKAIFDGASHIPAKELKVEQPWAQKVRNADENQKTTQTGWVK